MSSSGSVAKTSKAAKECQEIATAVKAFYADTGFWPGRIGGTSGLEDNYLTKEPPDIGSIDLYNDEGKVVSADEKPDKKNWNGPYLEAESWPTDPWKKYPYFVWSDSNKWLFVGSYGPDKKWNSGGTYIDGEAGGDDIVIFVNLYN